ncbi:MAG: hypothetical protein M1114_01015 [Candidatus Dependentiae bacterium]|nr:hypothetical protein [Candidatus Dependentiae bacterium]
MYKNIFILFLITSLYTIDAMSVTRLTLSPIQSIDLSQFTSYDKRQIKRVVDSYNTREFKISDKKYFSYLHAKYREMASEDINSENAHAPLLISVIAKVIKKRIESHMRSIECLDYHSSDSEDGDDESSNPILEIDLNQFAVYNERTIRAVVDSYDIQAAKVLDHFVCLSYEYRKKSNESENDQEKNRMLLNYKIAKYIQRYICEKRGMDFCLSDSE